MGNKVFKTTDELIQLLASRGMCMSSSKKGYAKKSLQHYGYYNLINGYNKLFLKTKDPEDVFKNGTTLEEIVALYEFDSELRNIVMKSILPFETNVKALIAYYFPKTYGHDNYMAYKNFDTSLRDAHKKIADVISDFQHQLASRATDPSIMHYLKEYGYVPLWVMNNVLTFGQISKFYSVMKQKDRMDISRTFKLLDYQFQSILYYLSTIRNFCAHGNRLYCYRSQKPIVDLGMHANLGIPKKNGEYEYGKRDLFACMIALKYVLPADNYRNMIKRIDEIIRVLKTKLKVVSIEEVQREMGFPKDWKKALLNTKK